MTGLSFPFLTEYSILMITARLLTLCSRLSPRASRLAPLAHSNNLADREAALGVLWEATVRSGSSKQVCHHAVYALYHFVCVCVCVDRLVRLELFTSQVACL